VSKYGEPWSAGSDYLEGFITNAFEEAVAIRHHTVSFDDWKDIMARIVACVNALAGKNPDALARFVFQAKMALGVLEAGPESMRVGARALRKAMEEFGA